MSLNKFLHSGLFSEGGFGYVFIVEDKTSKEVSVLKIIPKDLLRIEQVDLLKNEISVGRKAHDEQSPKLVQLFSTFWCPDAFVLRMELMKLGSVDMHMTRKNLTVLPTKIIKIISAHVVSGLRTLHKWKIVHRDLKPENLFIGEDGTLKLGDFGSSTTPWSDGPKITFNGTPTHASMECYTGFPCYESDLFSAGITIYELALGKSSLPAFLVEGKEGSQMYVDSLPKALDTEVTQLSDLPEEIRSLVSGLTKFNPKERLTKDELLKHPFFDPIDFDNPPRLDDQFLTYEPKEHENKKFESEFKEGKSKENKYAEKELATFLY